jgi:hypothetical protein
MKSAADVFAILRSALETAGIRYAIGGSWASTAFGEPRFTNNIDILADFTLENIDRFLAELPETFFADADEIGTSLRNARPFNVIYMPMAFKFDFFPASPFPLGAPFVTPEDILLPKPHWFRSARFHTTEGLRGHCSAVVSHRSPSAVPIQTP